LLRVFKRSIKAPSVTVKSGESHQDVAIIRVSRQRALHALGYDHFAHSGKKRLGNSSSNRWVLAFLLAPVFAL
jgi:hypothetical protein